jgi:hypothetical protein
MRHVPTLFYTRARVKARAVRTAQFHVRRSPSVSLNPACDPTFCREAINSAPRLMPSDAPALRLRHSDKLRPAGLTALLRNPRL